MEDLKWQTRDKNENTTNPLQRLRETLCFTSRDCSEDKMIAFMYGIICGWDDDAFCELKVKHNWSDIDIEQIKKWHENYNKAWNLFIDGHKESSIDFLEWVSKGNYWRLSENAGHKWFKFGTVPTFTTEELFELYQQSKQEQ